MFRPFCLLALLCLTASAASAAELSPTPTPIPTPFAQGDRILFQGDSITDGNRSRKSDPNHILGHGYQFILASRYGSQEPGLKLNFLNRGISGNRVSDLAGRWQQDALALAPQLLSILIGINDLSHDFGQNSEGAKQYEEAYDALLARTVAALPTVRLVLGEPFSLPVGKRAEHFDQWSAELKRYQAAVARLGAKYHAPVVHYQSLFDRACTRAPAEYWIWDGIHPTYAGHGLMAEEWRTTVETFYGASVRR